MIFRDIFLLWVCLELLKSREMPELARLKLAEILGLRYGCQSVLWMIPATR
jgi:hypothetical protein